MKFFVLLLPALILLGDTILDHTTILCNGATANIAVYIPPEQESEFQEEAGQYEKNLHAEDHIDSENHFQSHTTPSHVPLEEDKGIRVKKSFHPWSANGLSAFSDSITRPNPPKQRNVERLSDEDEDEDQVKCTSCFGLFGKTKIKDGSQSKQTPINSRHYIGSQVPPDGYDFGSREPPDSYDARDAYPRCKSISFIIDQSLCHSCWAITVAGAFSDRLCIQSGAIVNHNMSAIHLVSCSKENRGCWGGTPFKAWEYIEEYGLVTGGSELFNEGCQPYPSESLFLKTPKCIEEPCPISYKAKDIRLLQERNEYEIRREIYNYGPVTANIDFYTSFERYKGGIYRRSESPKKNPYKHGVRIIGWGEEDNQKYWIAANSAGKKWGENGFVKIPRGENYCGIEFFVTCATPIL